MLKFNIKFSIYWFLTFPSGKRFQVFVGCIFFFFKGNYLLKKAVAESYKAEILRDWGGQSFPGSVNVQFVSQAGELQSAEAGGRS